MREVSLFCEDSFHERYVSAFVRKVADEKSVEIDVRVYSSRGGIPRMKNEFEVFLRDIDKGRIGVPSLIVVVVDANCVGYTERRAQMSQAAEKYPSLKDLVVYAIPDPHIERWMLVDPNAFKAVFGKGCTLPTVKCARGEYKRQLAAEIRKNDISAALGGQEYAEDIVSAQNLAKLTEENSLRLLVNDLRAAFERWKAS